MRKEERKGVEKGKLRETVAKYEAFRRRSRKRLMAKSFLSIFLKRPKLFSAI